MGALTGAPFQISGPTGAMSAVLVVLVARYGLTGIWVAGLFSGLLLLIIGLLRLGRFIAFIPSPVISGFTSGIALIIFIGQIDNLLGIKTPAAETAAQKLMGYFHGGFTPDYHTILLGSRGDRDHDLPAKKMECALPRLAAGHHPCHAPELGPGLAGPDDRIHPENAAPRPAAHTGSPSLVESPRFYRADPDHHGPGCGGIPVVRRGRLPT